MEQHLLAADFELKPFLNSVLAVDATQETLSALLVKSQLISQDVSEALDQSTDLLINAMPRAVKEIARIQRECVELNDLLSDIMSEVNAINAESSATASSATDAEKTISSLDRVRTRMQTTATALTERTRWRSRTEQLEQAFAAGELATIAVEVAALRESMELLQSEETTESASSEDSTTHAQRSAFVLQAEARLEGIAAPELIAAFEKDIHTQDLARVGTLISVFNALRRLDKVRDIFLASRASSQMRRIVAKCINQYAGERDLPESSAAAIAEHVFQVVAKSVSDPSARSCAVVAVDSFDSLSGKSAGGTEKLTGSTLPWPAGTVGFLDSLHLLPSKEHHSFSEYESILIAEFPLWLPQVHSELLLMIDTHSRWFVQLLGVAGSSSQFSLSAVQLSLTESVSRALAPLSRSLLQLLIFTHCKQAAPFTSTLTGGVAAVVKHTAKFTADALKLILLQGAPSMLFSAAETSTPAADRLLHSLFLPIASLALQHVPLAQVAAGKLFVKQVFAPLMLLSPSDSDSSFLPSEVPLERGLHSARQSIAAWSRITLSVLAQSVHVAGAATLITSGPIVFEGNATQWLEAFEAVLRRWRSQALPVLTATATTAAAAAKKPIAKSKFDDDDFLNDGASKTSDSAIGWWSSELEQNAVMKFAFNALAVARHFLARASLTEAVLFEYVAARTQSGIEFSQRASGIDECTSLFWSHQFEGASQAAVDELSKSINALRSKYQLANESDSSVAGLTSSAAGPLLSWSSHALLVDSKSHMETDGSVAGGALTVSTQNVQNVISYMLGHPFATAANRAQVSSVVRRLSDSQQARDCLPAAWSMWRSRAQASIAVAERLVIDSLLRPIELQTPLRRLPVAANWVASAADAKNSQQQSLPAFTPSPSDVITQVGERLFALVAVLEPFTSSAFDDSDEHSEKIEEVDTDLAAMLHKVHAEPQSVAPENVSFWLQRVSSVVIDVILEQVDASSPLFSAAGRRQASADLAYLVNVLSALDVSEDVRNRVQARSAALTSA